MLLLAGVNRSFKTVLAVALAASACVSETPPSSVSAQTAAAGAPAERAATEPTEPTEPSEPTEPARVRVSGTRFVNADGSIFHWRGATAFRLIEQIARGREADAVAYLDWAKSSGITVVRVLTMARHLFELTPADGVAALPRLLTLAASRGVHVEVVALADTAEYDLDTAGIDAHVAAVGKIAAAHPNAFLEIANEPFHHTQHTSLHDRATLARLASLIPDEVVVAYGSDIKPETSGGGDYVTVHMPRGGAPWKHVVALAAGAALVSSYQRPVVSDEPIGVAAEAARGRRDNSPERMRAAALLTRMTGMHATFHHEAGLQGRIPEGIEGECFDAWREAWTLLPERIERGSFQVLALTQGAAFETRIGAEAWVLTIDGGEPPPGASLVRRWSESALFRLPASR